MNTDTTTTLLERAAERGLPVGAEEVWRRAAAEAERRTSSPSSSRRAVLIAAVVAVVIGGAALAASFGRDPEPVMTEQGTHLGIPLQTIPQGITPWVVAEQDVFISRNDEAFTVFIADAQHLPGDTLLWCNKDNLFLGAEHGEQFDRLGQKIGGPQQADLSRMASTINDGHLAIDNRSVLPGAWTVEDSPAPPKRDHPPYRFSGCKDGVSAEDAIGTDPGRPADGGTRPHRSDFVPAIGPDGDRVGYVRKADALPGPASGATLDPAPVYADDLTTLVGFMYPGLGFKPLVDRPTNTTLVARGRVPVVDGYGVVRGTIEDTEYGDGDGTTAVGKHRGKPVLDESGTLVGLFFQGHLGFVEIGKARNVAFLDKLDHCYEQYTSTLTASPECAEMLAGEGVDTTPDAQE